MSWRVGGRVGVDGGEIEPLDEAAARAAFDAAVADGIRACAIVLMHAWKYPAHEQRLAELAREAGFTQVSASHATSPLLRLIPRGDTTVVDAYLSPILRRYVDQVAAELPGVKLYFMQSNGGLAEASSFGGKDAILSGPAGGIVGAARTAEAAGLDRIIGFDMGGTSTDVALYDGAFERAFETAVAGVRIRAPMMAINTVAAGGGSILHFDGARYQVGPDSAGADPGPACYRRGGPLTVTDANVMVGKIQPAHFPAIFGPDADQPLDADVVAPNSPTWCRARTPARWRRGSCASPSPTWPTRSSRCRWRRATTPPASPCNASAAPAGSTPAWWPTSSAWRRCSSTRSPACCRPTAWGWRTRRCCASRRWRARWRRTSRRSTRWPTGWPPMPTAALAAQGADPAGIHAERRAHVRYAGTQAALEVPLGPGCGRTSRRRTGPASASPRRSARWSWKRSRWRRSRPASGSANRAGRARTGSGPEPVDTVTIWTGGAEHDAPVFERTALLAGDRVPGPALIREANATTVVEPGWTAEVTAQNHLLLRRYPPAPTPQAGETRSDAAPTPSCSSCSTTCSPTSPSRPASCSPTPRSPSTSRSGGISPAPSSTREGRLVANAPHVPVHLGAMGESVRTVLATAPRRCGPATWWR